MIKYYIFRFFETVFLAFPTRFQEVFMIGVAKVLYTIDSKHKKIIKANLDLTIKDNISEQKYKDIVKYCHKNLALVLLQVLQSSRLNLDELEKSIKIENRHYIDDAIKEGRKIILVSAHYGNWELGATVISGLVHPVTAIHKKMNDEYFNEYLLKSRSQFNMTMVEKKGAVRHLVKAIKNDKIIMMMMDQNINPNDGIYVDFLGAQATQSPAPAFLARKFDALIIPALINVTPGNDKVVTFFEPIITPKTDNEEEDILKSTQAQSDVLAKVVREHPEPWFWCHKRWKSAYPEIYN